MNAKTYFTGCVRFLSAIVACSMFMILSAATGAFTEIKKNDTAPGIVLRDINNRIVFVSNELKDKPVLVNFFFTSCAPCQKEIPELEKLYALYRQKVAMYLISTDPEGSEIVRPYVNKMQISIPVLIDKYSDIARNYGIDKYPSMVLIGKNGKVIFITSGYNIENVTRLEEILKRIK